MEVILGLESSSIWLALWKRSRDWKSVQSVDKSLFLWWMILFSFESSNKGLNTLIKSLSWNTQYCLSCGWDLETGKSFSQSSWRILCPFQYLALISWLLVWGFLLRCLAVVFLTCCCSLAKWHTISIMRILTGFVVVQENIKPEVLKIQTELARSVQ